MTEMSLFQVYYSVYLPVASWTKPFRAPEIIASDSEAKEHVKNVENTYMVLSEIYFSFIF